jgi:uncharacterized protein
MIDIDFLRRNNCIIFECISGSRAYGLQLPGSDTDIKGVFILPQNLLYGLHYTEQINNESNDVVFYELKRFIELLGKNNPNIIELLGTPTDCMLHRDASMDLLDPAKLLSKLCKNSFANYAFSQIKKAKGLNKKIFNPIEKERKSVLDFCHVTLTNGTLSLTDWLRQHGYRQEDCGLVKLNHMRDLYALYYDDTGSGQYKGIVRKENANEVTYSSIPKDTAPKTFLYFNKDGYSVYCKDYKAYWTWVEERNDVRYENTLEHGKNYDAKNMMHVFRLLNMAEEIALGKGIITRRPDREALLEVRKGTFSYDELMERAEIQLERIEMLYETAALPEAPNADALEALLVKMRHAFYKRNS